MTELLNVMRPGAEKVENAEFDKCPKLETCTNKLYVDYYETFCATKKYITCHENREEVSNVPAKWKLEKHKD